MRFKRCCCFFTSKQFISQRFITFWNQTHDVIDYHTSPSVFAALFQGLFLCLLLFFEGLFLLLCFVSRYTHFPLAVFSRSSLSSWTYFSPISSFYSDIFRMKTLSIYTLVSREKCSTVWESYSPRLCKPS